jgi:Fe-S-cluster containining protein
MPQPAISLKEATWLACKQKTCCYTSFVVVTGRDVWQISRILETPPWSFIVYFQSPQPRRDSFILDRSGRHFRLALAKQPSKRKKIPPPCIFLLKTRNGYHRCGLGDLRPQVCKSFPSEMVSGVLCVRNDAGCTCRTWSLTDVDIEEETARVEARQEEFEEYCAAVVAWNEHVTHAPPEETFSFFEYCNFLLNAYDEIESGQAMLVSD